jgi:alpha-amylase
VRLHDLTGRHADIWTDSDGNASFTIPSNAWNGGQSYLCFTRAFSDTPIIVNARKTTQTFFGSPDLSIGAATLSGAAVSRIWCEQGTEVALNKLSGNDVRFEVADAAGNKIIPTSEWKGKTVTRGWHSITAFAEGGTDTPYVVEVTYMGSQGLTSAEIKTE